MIFNHLTPLDADQISQIVLLSNNLYNDGLLCWIKKICSSQRMRWTKLLLYWEDTRWNINDTQTWNINSILAEKYFLKTVDNSVEMSDVLNSLIHLQDVPE